MQQVVPTGYCKILLTVLVSAATIAAVLVIGLSPRRAVSLPLYARQTGQPCATCHTAFLELTPFGRRFKLGGYTLGGGDWTGPPFAVMLQAPTFTHTEAGQEGGAAPHFGTKSIVAGPVHHADLLEEPVFREELMLITPSSLRGLDDLDRQPELKIIVFRHGCSYRQRLENLLSQRGIQTAKPLEFGSLDAILDCVAAGVGITLLPKAVVASSRKEGLVLAHELPSEEAHVVTMFIRRSDVYASSALNAFLAVARPSPLKLVVGD
jgi:hypothetical protein